MPAFSGSCQVTRILAHGISPRHDIVNINTPSIPRALRGRFDTTPTFCGTLHGEPKTMSEAQHREAVWGRFPRRDLPAETGDVPSSCWCFPKPLLWANQPVAASKIHAVWPVFENVMAWLQPRPTFQRSPNLLHEEKL